MFPVNSSSGGVWEVGKKEIPFPLKGNNGFGIEIGISEKRGRTLDFPGLRACTSLGKMNVESYNWGRRLLV